MHPSDVEGADVLVIGGGNAALCAALSARESGAEVIVVEWAPKSERGGNSAYTAGAMRVVYNDVTDLRELIADLDDTNSNFGTYTAEQFLDDLAVVTEYRCDPDLADELVHESRSALKWLRVKGVRFVPTYGRQAFKIDDRFTFWGGLTVEVSGGGAGLIETLYRRAEDDGVKVRYGTRAIRLLHDAEGVKGAVVRVNGQDCLIEASAVVLASGGFEANAEWRARYLGPGWELAKVRGTAYNFGDGIRMALDIGARPYGHWSGCHSVAWDRNAPDTGDLAVGDGYQKHSYPFGIMVNASGERFVDEGADFRNFTYAKYGRAILQQPGQVAWQVFDRKVAHLLRDEYQIRQVTKVSGDTLEELASHMDGVDKKQFLATVAEFNSSVQDHIAFNPNEKDGRCTVGLSLAKSNWANRLSNPPYVAYHVTCGITFTFGGLQIDRGTSVLGIDGSPIPGLYACGELVGGLFYFNYPGGAGLTSGCVFGRIAGSMAARYSGASPVADAFRA